MKYIRTKNGRIIDLDRIVNGNKISHLNENEIENNSWSGWYWYSEEYDYELECRDLDIIKQSDDLKELFDGYYLDIDNHPFDTTQIYGKDELQKALKERKDWQNYSDRKGLEYEINLYAFIKTDKGFIFVAKMNDKGDGELL